MALSFSMNHSQGDTMSWIENLPDDEKRAIRSWSWALHKSNPNALPLWAFWVPILFTPLTVFLFLRLNGEADPTLVQLLRDCGLFALLSLAAGVLPLPLTPLIKRYVYGPDSKTMLPRIGIWQERFVKFLFMALSNVLSSGVAAVFFMGWSGRSWASELSMIWQLTWTMSVASLPSMMPSFLVLIAKVKLVGLTRAMKRREVQSVGSEAATRPQHCPNNTTTP